MTDDGGQMIHHRDTEGTEKKEKDSVSPWYNICGRRTKGR